MNDVGILGPDGLPLAVSYTGAGSGFGNQLEDWTPLLQTADAGLLPQLKQGNARADHLLKNQGYVSGGVQLHIDNIVGSLFRLSCKPLWRVLGISEEDARLLAIDVEAAFNEYAEDPVNCYLDAERKRTFTMMVREAVGTHCYLGEAMASAEWIYRPGSVFRTAIKMISPKRVSNPGHCSDTANLRGGVESDRYSAATAYHVLNPRYGGFCDSLQGYGAGDWTRVPRETRWGRQQFIHAFEPREDGQSRGANQLLSVMEEIFMIDKAKSMKLQNLIVNSMYAAVIESELNSETAHQLITGGQEVKKNFTKWLGTAAGFHQGANVKMNGVKIPHLFPGESLNLKTPGNADNGFGELESSFLRNIAAGFNVSYEQLARDYSKVNYSSGRMSNNETWRYFLGRRKMIACKFASSIFSLVFEEMVNRNIITLPRKARYNFYDRKAAWCNAEWIGSGRLSIDGLKEVKEAILRIESGLSTYEKELAVMGEDYQEIFSQQVREMKERKEKGLPPASWAAVQAFAPEQQTEGEAA